MIDEKMKAPRVKPKLEKIVLQWLEILNRHEPSVQRSQALIRLEEAAYWTIESNKVTIFTESKAKKEKK